MSEKTGEIVKPFEEIEHTADLALRARGETREALFANAARGMMALAGIEIDAAQTLQREISLDAPDIETLLVDWLSELAYWLESETVAFLTYTLDVESTHLDGTLRGGPASAIQKHIKAITYHNLSVTQTPDGGFEATIVFDV